jgi:hypothetical protein
VVTHVEITSLYDANFYITVNQLLFYILLQSLKPFLLNSSVLVAPAVMYDNQIEKTGAT